MIVIQRHPAVWLCTAKEAFDNQNVQLRLPYEYKDFTVFEQALENETIPAGVITLYKCSDASCCKECEKHIGCQILTAAQETAQGQADFAAWAESNGGIVF